MHLQAHFTAPSSERRKLMSAPLNAELRTKYGVCCTIFSVYGSMWRDHLLVPGSERMCLCFRFAQFPFGRTTKYR